MADFEKVIRKHVNDEGNIPADSIQALVQSIQKTVGEGFVTVDRYNAKKTQLDELQTKLDESEGLQGKYDKLKTEYDNYKNETEAKETRIQKQDAYKEILKKAGIPEKRFAVILKTVDLDDLKISDGKLVDADKLEKSVKEEWSDFIVTTQETGVNSANPPSNNGGKSTMTKKEIMEIKDTAERQKAIAENHELFGF
jgi:hypothetical protein